MEAELKSKRNLDAEAMRIERDREVKAANEMRAEVCHLSDRILSLTEAVSRRQAQVNNLLKVAQARRDTVYKVRAQLREAQQGASPTPIVISKDDMLRLVSALPDVRSRSGPTWYFPVQTCNVDGCFAEPEMTSVSIEISSVGRRTRLWSSEARGWRIGQFLVVP